MDDGFRAECAGLGIDPDRLIPPELQHDEPEDCELWPEHWTAWQVYLGVGSQWRLQIGMGAVCWSAPSYSEVETVMRRYGVPAEEGDGVFRLYQVLESEALKVLNEAR